MEIITWLKKFKLFRIVNDFRLHCWELFLDWRSMRRLLCERKISRDSDVYRTAFLCQYIPAWNKFAPVYEYMKEDSRFEVFLICIPSNLQNHQLINNQGTENDTYDYFISKGYQAVNALTGENEWLDLKSLNLDYIFYPRPYNSFMPVAYTTQNVSKYAKICILMYGMTLTKEVAEVTLHKEFFRNVYCYFADSPYMTEVNKRHLPKSHKRGLQKSVYFGVPGIVMISDSKDEKNHAWDFARDRGGSLRVIWTPRWTTDLSLGGSNFFVYKDLLIKYAKEHPDVDFLFRPHPLALDNFLKTGEMTRDEVHAFIRACEETPNISLDKEPEYVASFWNSDVLITDISGVLPEYFVTGKPIIYCASNMILHPIDHTQKMIDACYVANTPEELFCHLAALKEKKDPMAQQRKKLAKELFGDSTEHVVGAILDFLAEPDR